MKRRTFLNGMLKGSAVSIGLPVFEAMLGINGEAFADGTETPTRFGVWFWGNGVRPEKWTPTTTGEYWIPNEETLPLLSHQAYLSIVSGCEIKTATHPHHSGMTGIFTGQKYQKIDDVRDTISSTFAAQSVDQIAADYFSGTTPFRSLEIGVTAFHGTDEGSTFQHLSHNGPNNFNPCEYSAIQLYNRLFGLSQEQELHFARQSILDSVTTQAARLNRRLGVADRIRLEQHLESIRTLEQQLAYEAPTCETPSVPGTYPNIGGVEQINEKNQIMSRLLALALSCDLSRVFSIQFSTAGSGVIFTDAGAVDGLHGICHTEAMPQPTVHAATTKTMGYLSDFLGILKDTPDGAGNLLDNSSILCTSELADGYTHSNVNFPIVVAGLGSGRLRGNMHYASTSLENTSMAVLSALRGSGVEALSFGQDEGYTEEGISDIEA
jgi:hypothetical protein